MKELSVAPKERINVKFVPATGDQQDQVELPMKMVVLGDFTGRADETPLDERRSVEVNKNTFGDVLREMELARTIEVKDTLREEDPDAVLSVNLKFDRLSDFEPDAVVQQVPELRKLADLREALTALKGPLGNMPSFRKALGELVENSDNRDALLKELEKGNIEAA
ncbi:type VI secretion system contractile sheath small subunit [Halocynthiibacter namhaensis]|uniref:type VI secretion system contractile sheath small subunit n=1 Tax=Halocynthiibacter namhaensis TaxID=1290553 RepID=UPI0005794704|nr:type VI secretion system contractile sheath small subunit [Halocynthiibacter namhaensis]